MSQASDAARSGGGDASSSSAISRRVPVLTGSITDLTVTTTRQATPEEIDAAYRAAAADGPLAGVLTYSSDPIVSSDIVGNPASCIYDAPLTTVTGRTVKVLLVLQRVGLHSAARRHRRADRAPRLTAGFGGTGGVRGGRARNTLQEFDLGSGRNALTCGNTLE